MVEPEGRPHLSAAAELKARIEAERHGTPFLIYRDDRGGQVLVALQGRGPHVTIGRRRDNDVALAWDAQVSRMHAGLEPRGTEWTLVDEGLSRNGSFVNGERVTGRHRLRDGDVVRVGRTQIAYRMPESPDSRPTVAAAGRAELPALTDMQRSVLTALCRPYKETELATPATNQQIADELVVSVDAVKSNLRALFGAFGVDDLPQNQK
ncbi:MAG: FHA domain-containing protein, partial [Gammaproteobacteria bacterium]